MSSDDLAVSVRNVGKEYELYHKASHCTTLGERVMHFLRHPFQKPERESFWALKNISFEISAGEVVGIVGRNGAGKSTLLKVLSQITDPSTGEIDLYGHVGSLLEVGTGFHPELTGRENIFLNGAIIGMRRREIQRQFDAIVDFAGIEKFLDTPVKRYSSGMYVRLAFAVAAHLNPDILIVDEVLAVGDTEFQKKCLGKMREVSRGQGRTVLFVSHNMAAVRQLCSKAIFLERGQIVSYGPTDTVLDLYNGSRTRQVVSREVNEHGLAFVDLMISDAQTGAPTDRPLFNRDYLVTARIRAAKPLPYAGLNLRFYDDSGARVTSLCTIEEGIAPFEMTGDVEIEFRIPRLGLFPGRYTVTLDVERPHDDTRYLSVDDAMVFEIEPTIIKDSMWAYEKGHGMARISSDARVVTGTATLSEATETPAAETPAIAQERQMLRSA